MNAEEIIKLIQEAFANVERGRITIHEAVVIDKYGSEYEAAKARLIDQESNWQAVPDGHITECWTALSFLDPESWRYYIPAYMCWTLKNLGPNVSNCSDSTVWALHLSNNAELAEHYLEHFRTLTDAQSHAVFCFLRFLISNDDYRNESDIHNAILSYWHQFQDPPVGRLFWTP